MRYLHFLLFTGFMLLAYSCSLNADKREEFAGDYRVKIELQPGFIPKQSIKDSINTGFDEAKQALKNARIELKKNLALEKVDTSTAEGKIEYAAKTFVKGMGEFGIAMGEFGKSMGELAAGVASGSLDLADSIVNNIRFDVSLNSDGTIKGNTSQINKFDFDESTWEIDGKTFYLVSKDKDKEAFEILNKKDDGFVLKRDMVKLVFTKKDK